MSAATVSELWDVLRRYEGVPSWWAELLSSIGFSAADAVTWMETSQRDSKSVYSALREKDLNVTLQGYAAARGITLLGAGGGDSVSSERGDRFVHTVSTVTTVADQEAIVKEVGAYADVRFREKVKGVYTQHAVANAVRSVHQAYLRRAIPAGATVLEAGASLKSAVLAGVDPEVYHCCNPVLDARDSVRSAEEGFLRSAAAAESKYKPSVRVAARAALDPSSGFVCRMRAQECTRQVDVVCSNESTHDIAFDDLPVIMSRHGARLWIGFATRAVGVRSVGGPVSGRCEVLGTRWRLDRAADRIEFHFSRGSSFSYTHEFSEWVKYEERFGYRWRGRFFDYVYARVPITTKSSLAFVVARVPKASPFLADPVYKSSGLAGMVEVKSVKAVGGCLGGAQPQFEPVTFCMEALVFDRVLETRLAQGERGNLASTIAYMRSARVRLVVNGVALGVVTSVPVEVLEPAAVAVEVLAADGRRAGARDYAAIMSASAPRSVMTRILSYFSGVTSWVAYGRAAVRDALLRAVGGTGSVVVSVRPCERYVEVSRGGGVGEVSGAPALQSSGCGCGELMSVRAALVAGTALTAAEARELEAYATVLSRECAGCKLHANVLGQEGAAGDVREESGEESVEVSETSDGSTAVDSVFSASGSGSSESSECEELTVEPGVVSRRSEQDEGLVVKSVREYAAWAQQADACARSEAALAADVMFLRGPPTQLDVERATTARTRHAVVSVIGGKLGKSVGTMREDELAAEVYVPSLRRTCVVHRPSAGVAYIRENVTELCYTSNLLLVMNGDALCREALATLQSVPRGFSFPQYVFIAGVPGCGKTHESCVAIVEAVRAGKSVAYLTATVASKDEVARKVGAEVGDAKFVCRTFDSYLKNGADAVDKADLLLMDEAPMAHFGELSACMLRMRAVDVRLYGDDNQIPWLPFMADFRAEYALLGAAPFKRDRRRVTHRFGVLTCAMWLDVYGEIFPCECHEHEDVLPEVVRVASASEVPALPTGKVLTFTQEERVTLRREMGFLASVQELKTRNAGGLSTVAEDQGGTHEDVSVVRVVNKRNPKESRFSPSIYNRQPWVLVATTRHKRRLRYYTTSGDDLVCARIELAQCAVRQEAVRQRKPWSAVADRAAQVREFGI